MSAAAVQVPALTCDELRRLVRAEEAHVAYFTRALVAAYAAPFWLIARAGDGSGVVMAVTRAAGLGFFQPPPDLVELAASGGWSLATAAAEPVLPALAEIGWRGAVAALRGDALAVWRATDDHCAERRRIEVEAGGHNRRRWLRRYYAQQLDRHHVLDPKRGWRRPCHGERLLGFEKVLGVAARTVRRDRAADKNEKLAR